jgi:hypothetical protein
MTDTITLPRATVQQALEALETSEPKHGYACKCQGSRHWPHCFWQRHQDTIEALRAALEQPEQAPAAWINPKNLQGLTLGLYGYAEIYADESQGRIPLYTHPPRREWRGLTLEEVQDSYNADYQAQTRAIEAALKERNA